MERLCFILHRDVVITLVAGCLLVGTIQAAVDYIEPEHCVTSSNEAGHCMAEGYCRDPDIVELRTSPCSDRTMQCCPIPVDNVQSWNSKKQFTECDSNRGYCVESNKCSVKTTRTRSNRCPTFEKVCCPKSAFPEQNVTNFVPADTLTTTTTSYPKPTRGSYDDIDPSSTEEKHYEKPVPSSTAPPDSVSANTFIPALKDEFSPESFSYQECGQQNLNGVVDSTLNEEFRAEYGEFPWMVALFQLPEKRYCCNGALIGERMILTTAQCVHHCGGQATNIVARFGEWNMSSAAEMPIPRVEVGVKSFYKHPNYQSSSLINNIALLKLSNPIQYGPTIQPVCLPSSVYLLKSFARINMIATGWGSITVSNLSSTQILKRMDLQKEETSICINYLQKRYGKYRLNLHSSLTCSTTNDPEKERPCEGDAGSPVVVEIPGTTNRYYLHGLVSWGYGCNQKRNTYTMLTHVVEFREWIDSLLSKH